MDSLELAKIAYQALDDKKGKDIVAGHSFRKCGRGLFYYRERG